MRTRWLAKFIYDHMRPKRDADFTIGPSKDDPYMRRWWIIPRNRFLNIYMHQILHDDDDRALHDHPWASLSLNLTGGLTDAAKAAVQTKHVNPQRLLKIQIRSSPSTRPITLALVNP